MKELNEQQKNDIIAAAKAYLEQHQDVKQPAFAKLVGIDKTFVNQMLLGKRTIGTTQIADKYFQAIARYVNLGAEEPTWRHFNTHNFKLTVNKLNAARNASPVQRCGIDGGTGLGKTYACQMYKKRHPANTFLVKCAATENAKEFVQAIAVEVEVNPIGTKGALVKRICSHLINLGNNPILIIDEAENLGRAGIEIVKVIADELENRVAFAIVGLGIKDILMKGNLRNRQGYIQTNRRFSYGWAACSKLTTDDISEVCSTLGITNQAALNWMFKNIADYDSLHRVCHEALTEARITGKEVNRKMLELLFNENINYTRP